MPYVSMGRVINSKTLECFLFLYYNIFQYLERAKFVFVVCQFKDTQVPIKDACFFTYT